jgi:hypothetical protein
MCFFLYRMVMMPLHRDKNEERERRKTLSPRKRKWVSLHQLMHLSTPCSRVHPQGKLSHFCHKFCSQGHGEFQNFAILINNGNWTEWSAIWTEIKRVITKSHDREAGVQFVITSLISVQNCTTRSSISTLLYSFWNFKTFL